MLPTRCGTLLNALLAATCVFIATDRSGARVAVAQDLPGPTDDPYSLETAECPPAQYIQQRSDRTESFADRWRSIQRRCSWQKSTSDWHRMYWDNEPYWLPNFGYFQTHWRQGASFSPEGYCPPVEISGIEANPGAGPSIDQAPSHGEPTIPAPYSPTIEEPSPVREREDDLPAPVVTPGVSMTPSKSKLITGGPPPRGFRPRSALLTHSTKPSVTTPPEPAPSKASQELGSVLELKDTKPKPRRLGSVERLFDSASNVADGYSVFGPSGGPIHTIGVEDGLTLPARAGEDDNARFSSVRPALSTRRRGVIR